MAEVGGDAVASILEVLAVWQKLILEAVGNDRVANGLMAITSDAGLSNARLHLHRKTRGNAQRTTHLVPTARFHYCPKKSISRGLVIAFRFTLRLTLVEINPH